MPKMAVAAISACLRVMCYGVRGSWFVVRGSWFWSLRHNTPTPTVHSCPMYVQSYVGKEKSSADASIMQSHNIACLDRAHPLHS